ncbi:hypothetical protein E0I74_15135 [Rhizobium laguerreae]|uniref:hypothetical protein n=1 Tax=Rhizobium laguerreae TaxID=1076926 RepID=UPI00103E1B9F|nr:hypothetical protein [Rhizobium laguerreae]TBX78051.1 hypothetical protein E0I74_15135 [Rhizobium laguerreae]
MATHTEEQVHQHLYSAGLEEVVKDCPIFDDPAPIIDIDPDEEPNFELWRLIKRRAYDRLQGLHNTVRYGSFVGSKISLPIDSSRSMELDLLGTHEDGLFVLELKVDRSAERNAFSELFAYSNYIAGMFALSGHRDITNVLVANLDVKITRQAFLYDLLINDRNIIVYKPSFSTDEITSLALDLWLPSDDDFQHFTNDLLSHEAMACAVISFDDLEGWYDSEEEGGSLNEITRKHLTMLSGYAAQLMEAERLHGFCFIRKPWKEIPRYYRNSLFICALNPFRVAVSERANAITAQINPDKRSELFEMPEMAFDGRVIQIAQRALRDCLAHNSGGEVETPYWGSIVETSAEVVFTHNFGFRPTGMLREAYTSYLNERFEIEAAGGWGDDLSMLKINNVNNWLQAWEFMRMCGFARSETEADLREDDGGEEPW